MTTIISASTRPTDSTHSVAFLFQDMLESMGQKVRIVTPSDFDLPYDGAKDSKWTEIVKTTDHFVLVTPEYNHSFPGKLKTLIDAEYDEYATKKIIICGVSSGTFGGARGVISLLPVLHKVGFDIFPIDLFVPLVKEMLENDSKKTEWIDRTSATLNQFLT